MLQLKYFKTKVSYQDCDEAVVVLRSEAASEGLQEAVEVHDEALDERIVGLVVGELD